MSGVEVDVRFGLSPSETSAEVKKRISPQEQGQFKGDMTKFQMK
jgi:hypothetical protein